MAERYIDTFLTGPKNVDIIHGVLGQLSDGMWLNSPRMEPYWKNATVELQNGEVFIKIKDQAWNNPYNNMDDDLVKQWFAKKIKRIVFEEFEGMSSKIFWNRTNTQICDYLNYYSGVTVSDCYFAYDTLMGRSTTNKTYVTADSVITDETDIDETDIDQVTTMLSVFNNLMKNHEIIKEDREDKPLTIDDIIIKLKEARKKYGNIDVEVQYRDDGGEYSGSDTSIYFYYKDGKLLL